MKRDGKLTRPRSPALPLANVETQDDRELLRRIIEYGINDGVVFRAALANDERLAGSDARFVRKLANGRRVRHVYVLRDRGGDWADKRDASAFLAGATAPLHETIKVAHELGHDQLDTDERGDRRQQVEAQVQRQEQIEADE